MMGLSDGYTLANGVKIPCVGLGTWKGDWNQPDNDVVSHAVQAAIEAGFRHIDTAASYRTEEGVGRGIRESGIPRSEVFVTTKLWNDVRGYQPTIDAFHKSMKSLGLDYLDLYLIHWPLPSPDYEDWKKLDIETWRALEELYEEGRIRAIGLSNFLPHHIENLLENCKIKPMTDQLEFHPGYRQEAAVNYCKEHDMLVQAWSPIGRRRVIEEPLITSLAEKYGVSPAKICLAYAVQKGVMPLPKASTAERMKENLDLFSFELEKEDVYRLATMPQAGWSGEHPDRETVRP